MSALQVYLNWANSVLSDCDPPLVVTVDTIRQGKVICRLIETFWNAGKDQGLEHWELVPGSGVAIDYIQAALCHFESQNIKANFTAEDILKGDIKSILDLLWLLILNYNIHDAGTNQYHQCSVGAGRRNLLAWCQNILAGLQLDKRCSLVKSLCINDRFLMLLESTPGLQLPVEDLTTKSQHLVNVLENIESQLGIKKDILSVPELIAGTIDEQILMIYLALLKWKIENKQTKPSHQHLSDLPHRQAGSTLSLSPPYFEQTHYGEMKAQTGQPEKQTRPQSRPSVSSAEKDEAEATSHCAASRTTDASSFESAQTVGSISTAMIKERELKTVTPPLRSLVHSFSFRSDDGETPMEDELAYASNTVPYRNSVNTRIYSRSLTPTLTRSNRQDELRPNYTDFRTSPSLLSRPLSSMALGDWADTYDAIKSTDLRPTYSTSISDDVTDTSTPIEHLGDSTDNFEISHRSQETVKQSDDGSPKCNLEQQGTLTTIKDSKNGMYSFKRVIIKKDGNGAHIHEGPEKNDHWQSPTNIPESTIVPRSLTDDRKYHDKMRYTVIKNKKCITSDLETEHPPPPPLNAPPPSPPIFEMEQFREIKSVCIKDRNYEQTVDANNTREEEHAAQAENSVQPTGNRNESEATEKKMADIVNRCQDGVTVPNGYVSSVDPPSTLTAASMTSRKIDILCIEIGELKKKVMAMETGRTSLEDLNRTFQNTIDSNPQIANHSGDGQRSRELGRGVFSKTRSHSQDSISERMNQSWSPTVSSLLDQEPDFGRNDLRKHSRQSLSHDLMVNFQKKGGNSLEKKETVSTLDSPAGVVSPGPSKENKEHLWKYIHKGADVIDQRRPLFMERYMKPQNHDDFSSFSKSVEGAPKSPVAPVKVNQQVSTDKKQDSIELFDIEDEKVSSDKILTQKCESFHLDSPSEALFDLGKDNREIDELLFRCAPGGNVIVSRMCSVMRQLKQENNNLKNRLQQEIVKMKMLDEDLQGMQNENQNQCEQYSERAQFELTVQQNQTRLQQENVELRERLRIADELNEQLKADVLYLQQYKTKIQSTQKCLRERILQAEMDKKILSEELNLLWRQRKALRQSNYETGTKKTSTTDTEDVSTPPKSKPSLVEAAFSNRLHQADRKSSSPLTSSPAGQKLSVAPFPVSPVVSNNIENQTPDRHGFGVFYPETPKTYRTVSYLDREKNCLTSKKRPSPGVSFHRRIFSMDSDLELDELLDEVEGHSIAYGEDFDDDSDDYDKDVIQLQKRSRLYWSDEDLSRRSENQPGSWTAAGNLDQNSRSSSDLHLSQTTTPQNSGRRRMNNVTFNLSNSVDNVPSKQSSILRGILKKTSSPNQCNTNGLVDNVNHQNSTRSKIPCNQRPHHHSSEDLFMEISQQDFFKPPNYNTSNSAQEKLAHGIGKRWSSHESLNSKYSLAARQKDVDEFDSAQIFKSPPVNPNDINFSFNEQISESPKFQHPNQQNRTYFKKPNIIRNYALFRQLMRENAMDSSPEAKPLFGDPENSMWSFTPYNFYMETLSRHLNDQNRYTKDAKADNAPAYTDVSKIKTKEQLSCEVNANTKRQKPTVLENSSPVKSGAAANSVDRSTPAKIGPSNNSAGSDGSQKFSAVLSPEQVQFSPTTEADHQAIVRNLCSVFENSDLSIDGSEPGSAKKSRTWYDLDKNSPAQLTDEQRVYANTLIEKYTRLPTEKVPKSTV